VTNWLLAPPTPLIRSLPYLACAVPPGLVSKFWVSNRSVNKFRSYRGVKNRIFPIQDISLIQQLCATAHAVINRMHYDTLWVSNAWNISHCQGSQNLMWNSHSFQGHSLLCIWGSLKSRHWVGVHPDKQTPKMLKLLSATAIKFGRYIHRVHPNKYLKFRRKGGRGRDQGLPKVLKCPLLSQERVKFQIWPVHSQGPSEQKPIKNFGEAAVLRVILRGAAVNTGLLHLWLKSC